LIEQDPREVRDLLKQRRRDILSIDTGSDYVQPSRRGEKSKD
jgi:hypothetical protein